MRRRRGRTLGLTAALSAAVLLAGTTTSARAAPGTATGSAGSGSTRACVALVVDARSIGSNVATSCPKVAGSATGVTVLQAGGHSLGFRDDGLLCTIDGLPKSGCADVSDTHYWAYYHRAAGSTRWVYSSEGPATYEPAPGTTEGWVYDNGRSLTPQSVSYATICGCRVTTVSPSATPKPPTPKPPTPKPATPTSGPSHAPASPSGSTAPTPAKSSATGSSSRPASPAASATTTRQDHGGGPATSPASPATSSSVLSATRDPSPSSATLAGAVGSTAGGGHGLLDLLIVVLVVAALAAFAVAQSRRRHAR